MSPDLRELLAAARRAARNAYNPYSRFAVGAAVLSSDGTIFAGTNVENASFGLAVCAERVALFSAVAAGHRQFSALAVAGTGNRPVTPCGACRQVLSEFCPAGMPIAMGALEEEVPPVVKTLGDLLPLPFRKPEPGERDQRGGHGAPAPDEA